MVGFYSGDLGATEGWSAVLRSHVCLVVTAAGLNAAEEEATSQNLVVAEAGTVDPATAGAAHVSYCEVDEIQEDTTAG
jgi:hypothetical protein